MTTAPAPCVLCVLLCAAVACGAPDLTGVAAHRPGDQPAAAVPLVSSFGGVPDLGYASDGVSYGVGQVVTAPAGSPQPVPSSFVPQPQRAGARPAANPFFSGTFNLPAFQVAVQPVLPASQRPTPEPIREVNTNPLGGPAGPKGPVRASCPGPASALPCVPDAQCDPYTGILKSDGYKLPYPITKDTPTVAIGQCKLGGGRVGVCCKRLPKPPKPTPKPTALPLGVDYGQGLDGFKPKPTPRPPNPFLPEYNPPD